MHRKGNLNGPSVLVIEDFLFRRYGDLKWWPSETADEMAIGAILTQNTSWKNVEKSLSNLRYLDALSCGQIVSMPESELEKAIRSSGFFRQKSMRIKAMCRAVYEEFGNFESMAKIADLEYARSFLSSLNGIGRETMNSILLYGLGFPVFVMDKYTGRIISRLGYDLEESRKELPEGVIEKALKHDVPRLRNLHAMFVEVGKNHCRKSPICGSCPLEKICDYSGKDEIVP